MFTFPAAAISCALAGDDIAALLRHRHHPYVDVAAFQLQQPQLFPTPTLLPSSIGYSQSYDNLIPHKDRNRATSSPKLQPLVASASLATL
ncbi:hypothetical protein B296_00023932 [Ensete ventricosum]|uniref:Uncharacterized protein n=1 Tax=Ensete ventricosum TaxID=4639 RepID=A0A427A6B6_ENSVE|nr:hypothetical protein B296_00023932 [Ensete ventricosum]